MRTMWNTKKKDLLKMVNSDEESLMEAAQMIERQRKQISKLYRINKAIRMLLSALAGEDWEVEEITVQGDTVYIVYPTTLPPVTKIAWTIVDEQVR